MLIAIALVAYSTSNARREARISLPLNELELMARAEPVKRAAARVDANKGLRLAPPPLRDESAMAPPVMRDLDGQDAEDMLETPDAFDIAQEEETGEIVIRIEGGNQPAEMAKPAGFSSRRAQAVPEPDPALMRPTAFGVAPRIAEDGRRSMTYYVSTAGAGAEAQEKIAIIVGGLGLNAALTERAIDELPPQISLAFAPYAKDLKFWTEKARRAGHEVIIELPMEGYGGDSAALGAAGLMTTRTTEENLQRLEWLMSRFDGYFAATNYLGAKFSAQKDSVAPILARLAESGVAYIDDTGAAQIALGDKVAPLITVNRIIPPAPDEMRRAEVRRSLRALEEIAARDGAALGKTYAYGATLNEIIDWARALDEEKLVPASAVLRLRLARR